MAAQKRISDFFMNSSKRAKPTGSESTTDSTCSTHDDSPSTSANSLPVREKGANVCQASREEEANANSTPEPRAAAGGQPQTLTFQPRDHAFPRKCFGDENFSHSFQPLWFDKWRWLQYTAETDCVFCFACLQAVLKKLVSSDQHG